MSDFRNVIRDKVTELSGQRDNLMKLATNSGYHASQAKKSVGYAIPEIEKFEGTIEELKAEAVSLLNQVPELVESTWKDIADQIRLINSEIDRWSEMYSLYDEWETSTAQPEVQAAASIRDEIKEKINSGEIQEPSKKTAMRRKPGTRPPVTLSQYRRAQTSGGEDPEA